MLVLMIVSDELTYELLFRSCL